MTSRLETLLVLVALSVTGCALAPADADPVATSSASISSSPGADATSGAGADGAPEDAPIVGSVTSDTAGQERFSGGHPQPWAPPPSRVAPPKPEK